VTATGALGLEYGYDGANKRLLTTWDVAGRLASSSDDTC